MTRRTQRGSSVLYVVILSPIIFLSLALALEVGALQMQKERLRSAADMATVTAGSAGATVVGGTHLDAATTALALRQSLVDNLAPLEDQIVGTTPTDIAATADVFVIATLPATDPLDASRTITRPTIETRLHIPVRSGLLSVAGLPPTVTLTVTSSADLRIVGGTGA